MAYTTIDRSTDHFRVKTYTGNGADNRAITFDETKNMQPDFCWFKDRTGANSHNLFDVVRGVQKPLLSNSASAELSGYDLFDSFNTNGFTVSGSTADNTNFNGSSFVNWSWKANGAGVSNTAGTITSTVSANTTSGFSIVKWTGTGATGTIGHGLGIAPKLLILKDTSNTYNWYVYTSATGSNIRFEGLNTTNASASTPSEFTTTSTLITNVTSTASQNTSGANMLLYCFAEVKGFSKIGSYTGNGSSDGTFVYTGFKPAFLLIKSSSASATTWFMFDNKRASYNVVNKELYAEDSQAEATVDRLDFCSNGFKCRNTSSSLNASGSTYIYMAFAENPFVSSKGIPTTAR